MATPSATEFGTYQTSEPEWLQSTLTAHRVIQPGGIYLDPTAFSVAPYLRDDGRLWVPSGTIIYRSVVDQEAGDMGYSPLLAADAATILLADVGDYQIGINYGTIWDLREETSSAMIQAKSGNQILVNFLPNQANVTADTKSVLRRAGFILLIGKS